MTINKHLKDIATQTAEKLRVACCEASWIDVEGSLVKRMIELIESAITEYVESQCWSAEEYEALHEVASSITRGERSIWMYDTIASLENWLEKHPDPFDDTRLENVS
jgi:hypothetical protein